MPHEPNVEPLIRPVPSVACNFTQVILNPLLVFLLVNLAMQCDVSGFIEVIIIRAGVLQASALAHELGQHAVV